MTSSTRTRGRPPRTTAQEQSADSGGSSKEVPKAPEGTLAWYLAAARIKADITKTQMAEKLRVRPPVITKIESGAHDISESTVKKYALALGCRYELKFVKATKE
ncbi:XRE family transcriptional regulator [Candidatus Dependentiae bacterium]|nr:MAG: XRE family transcriptional regulator [Candidatus Dependentiae bacterium]